MQTAQKKTSRFFHAKDDMPEVRLHVFRVLRQHGVRFSAVVKDKLALLESVRARQAAESAYRYRADGHELYDSMMRSLFARVGRFSHHRYITFAVRGNKPRTHVLTETLKEVERESKNQFRLSPHKDTTVRSAYPWEHAGLQACDYLPAGLAVLLRTRRGKNPRRDVAAVRRSDRPRPSRTQATRQAAQQKRDLQ